MPVEALSHPSRSWIQFFTRQARHEDEASKQDLDAAALVQEVRLVPIRLRRRLLLDRRELSQLQPDEAPGVAEADGAGASETEFAFWLEPNVDRSCL